MDPEPGCLIMLTFNESLHEYRFNGVIVPGVTTILKPLVDYSMVNPEVLERGRLLGQAVHKMTELHDQDDLDEDALDSEMVPYLDAWKKFRADTGFEPVTIEARMYHKRYRYCGTSDRTGTIKGKLAVVDIKKMLTLGPVIGIQLAAYQAAHVDAGLAVTHRYALGLRADGTYRLEPFTEANDFAVFLSLLTVHNWKARHGK
ncbi:hypothetical protein ACFQAT_07945 [Undibacterium arcticum]|uniref:PD-(D/E)XK endonuclease-like domain-containing protein n=1 Tax=Undibacterium arcticum TaxID=1762892 RepID=A0ABV7F0W8_9BURK